MIRTDGPLQTPQRFALGLSTVSSPPGMTRKNRFGPGSMEIFPRSHAGSAPWPAGWCGEPGVVCSSACSKDAADKQRHLRRSETPRRMGQRTRWTTCTLRPSVDEGRFTHNPEVEGSNPSPATKARGPFLNREGAFRMRLLTEAGLRAFIAAGPVLAGCGG
jgi:hypothetical protein